MSTEKFFELSKQTVVPISLTLLAALVAGVWALAWRVYQWETRLGNIEQSLSGTWTYMMEREAWREAAIKNPNFERPDLEKIRRDYGG